MSRRTALIFIHIFVVIQLALPLSYYLWRHDRLDERFAWRMFSYDRMTQCTPRFYIGDVEDKKTVPLHTHFHEAWVNIARRGRQVVIEAMAEKLCGEYEDLRFHAPCGNPADKKRSSVGSTLWNVCPSGRIK